MHHLDLDRKETCYVCGGESRAQRQGFVDCGFCGNTGYLLAGPDLLLTMLAQSDSLAQFRERLDLRCRSLRSQELAQREQGSKARADQCEIERATLARVYRGLELFEQHQQQSQALPELVAYQHAL